MRDHKKIIRDMEREVKSLKSMVRGMSKKIAIWNQKRHEQKNYLNKISDRNKRMSRTIYGIKRYTNLSWSELLQLKKLVKRSKNLLKYKHLGTFAVFLTANEHHKLTTLLKEDARLVSIVKHSLKNGRHLITLNDKQLIKLKRMLMS